MEKVKTIVTPKVFLIWFTLFFLTMLIGMLTYDYFIPILISAFKLHGGETKHLEAMVGLSAFHGTMIIFFSNLLTVTVMIMLGRLFWGLYPAVIVSINGFVVGFMGILLSQTPDFSLFKYFLIIIPHGIIEIPALLIAAIIAVSTTVKYKDKFKLLAVPAVMLFVSSIIEVFVSARLL